MKESALSPAFCCHCAGGRAQIMHDIVFATQEGHQTWWTKSSQISKQRRPPRLVPALFWDEVNWNTRVMKGFKMVRESALKRVLQSRVLRRCFVIGLEVGNLLRKDYQKEYLEGSENTEKAKTCSFGKYLVLCVSCLGALIYLCSGLKECL